MSKAFTKEETAEEEVVPALEPWPEGVRNYLTPAGHAALRAEIERVRAEVGGAAPERKRLREARLAALVQRLEAAEVVEPRGPADVARFGATVTVEDDDGRRQRWRIVGVDEADPRHGWLSWRAPVARALVGKRVGETATVRTPHGEEELTVVSVDWE